MATRTHRTPPRLAVVCVAVLGGVAAAVQADEADGPREVFPGVTLDRAAGHVDLDATVVGREVEWLELLACRPGTREYESVVSVAAEAEHIQLGLLLLGLEPGSPARAERVGDRLVQHPPTGPELKLQFVVPGAEGADDRVVPASDWVVDQQDGEPMPDNVWLFTGSRFVEHAGKRWFLAEANGTLVSVVNFGDELVGRPTTQSEAGGNVFWTSRTDVIPPNGTAVRLRIRPRPPAAPASEPRSDPPAAQNG
ncbi:MAG: YdjY domain-containing protein [Planctomycetota bacterium]